MAYEDQAWPSRRKSIHVTFRIKPELYDIVVKNNPQNLSKSLNEMLNKAVNLVHNQKQ